MAQKVSYIHLIQQLQYQFDRATQDDQKDFFYLLEQLSQHYHVCDVELLRCGLRRAYRQLVEGVI